jgi:peptidase C13-like protein
MRRLAVLLLAVVCAGGCAIAPTSAKWREKSDTLLAAQAAAAEQAKTAGGEKVIFAGFALNSESTAFQGDALRAREALRSLNPTMPAFVLSNQLETADIGYPFATKQNVAAVLSRVAALAGKDSLVLVLLTSHGVPNRLVIKIGQGEVQDHLSPEELKGYLEPLRSIPTVVIISSCFSGSFIPALAADNRIVITAAARDRTSFGCAPESKGTYFIDALFGTAFDGDRSLSSLFMLARRQVADRERSQRLRPSLPQISTGGAMYGISGVPLRQVLAHP